MFKNVKNLKYWVGCIIAIMMMMSCKENPETFAIHSPIYPTSGDAVTYTLRKIEGDVEKVRLLATTHNINSSGSITTSGAETLLKEWRNPSFPLSFTTTSGYGTNKLVEYRFEVFGNDKTYTHKIRYATNPYPVTDAAIPVYAVGEVEKVLNVVFIPDEDMADDLDLFYNNVGENIHNSFHEEEFVRRFRRSYNFYVNPHTAIAGDYNIEPFVNHIPPSNDRNLDFAQGRIILHAANYRDFSNGRYVGTEYYNRGTILHETGHLLYGLADEYGGGSHRQAEELPNNWRTLAGAQTDAPSRGKTASDAVEMGTDNWYKLCDGQCIMLLTGRNVHPYDRPCQDKILFTVLNKASGN